MTNYKKKYESHKFRSTSVKRVIDNCPSIVLFHLRMSAHSSIVFCYKYIYSLSGKKSSRNLECGSCISSLVIDDNIK